MHCVADCVIRRVIPQPSEWQAHRKICLPSGLGFLRVTERSQELDKVLENFATDFDAEEWTENFRKAVEYRHEVFRTNPYKYNTLVQVCWKLNY